MRLFCLPFRQSLLIKASVDFVLPTAGGAGVVRSWQKTVLALTLKNALRRIRMNNIRIIAEGINHNGDMDICKKLIDVAVASGCMR